MAAKNHEEAHHHYEGVVYSPATPNKRSLADHLVGYVKKTSQCVPRGFVLSPKRKINSIAVSPMKIKQTGSSKTRMNKPVENQQSQAKRGALCLEYSISTNEKTNETTILLHIIRARRLCLVDANGVHQSCLNTFVKVSFSSEYEQFSKIVHGCNSPVYDETFTIVCNNKSLSTTSKRLTISVHNHTISNKKSDLIGCMSFNMKTLLKTSTTSSKSSTKSKWYCLLPESIGRHKRMTLNVNSSSAQTKKITTSITNKQSNASQSQNNRLLLNVTIYDRDEIQFASGFPCTISEVKSGIGSTFTRPMPGDLLLQVNEINVSRTQAKAVKKLLKSLPLPITLQLYRRSQSIERCEFDKIIRNSVDQHQPLNVNMFSNEHHNQHQQPQHHHHHHYHHNEDAYLSSIHVSESIHSAGHLPKPIRRTTDLYASLLMSPIDRQTGEHSDESESGVGSESNPYSDGDEEQRLKTMSESYEREALHLISIEKEFIRQIELGVQLYSRPLKHYLISSHEHGKLFQNIEKILAISRYQLNRLQSLSERTIISNLGKIFHEKVQMICEAFTRYMSGYSDASAQLKQLSKCASFQRFIQNGQNQLSIEQFLQIPLNHIENLAQQLDILCCTCENANDANYLLHVLKELRQCSLHLSTIESSTSQYHCTTTMSLNSASGTSSMMHQTDDQDIVQLQSRLQFPKHIKPLVLTGRNRHIIFSGILYFQNENKTYVETWAILLNDMLLITEQNSNDDKLNLLCNPIFLQDIVDFRSSDEREDALIFLFTRPNMPYKLRYPSKCLQYAWQTILEQRLKTWQRSMHDDSSSNDSDLE